MQARCLTEREKERFKCFSIRGDFIKAEIPASREGCGGRLRERERDCSSVRWPRPEEDCESSKSVEGNREGRRNTGEEKRKKMGDERKLKEREREREKVVRWRRRKKKKELKIVERERERERMTELNGRALYKVAKRKRVEKENLSTLGESWRATRMETGEDRRQGSVREKERERRGRRERRKDGNGVCRKRGAARRMGGETGGEAGTERDR